jgi:HPt (histidine-containing phosphotransfer) domain-containing protein
MKPSAEVNVQPHLAVCDLPAALARMGANVELVREMLDLFREDAPIYQLRLHDALAASNAPGIELA